jgi:hypothetical protein
MPPLYGTVIPDLGVPVIAGVDALVGPEVDAERAFDGAQMRPELPVVIMRVGNEAVHRTARCLHGPQR